MELTWIEDFLALYRAQNFTEAAEQRCTTQSAFSRRVQLLEEWLGTKLFDRATRPIRLTASGEDFLRRAQRIREDILDARRIAMSSQSHYSQAVRIYATTAISVGIVPKWLKQEGHLNHSVLTSSTGGCLEALRQKRADKVFLPWFVNDEKDSQLKYTKVAEDNLILVEPAQKEKCIVFQNKTLKGKLIMHTPGTIFGQQIARRLTDLKIACERHIVCESSSTEALLSLVKQKLGAAWVPQSMLDSSVTRCDVPKEIDVPCSIMLITRLD